MTKAESRALFVRLRKFNETENLECVKLAYAISRNIDILKPEIEAVEKTLEFSEKFKEFNKEHIELVDKYTEKDENGVSVKEITVDGEGNKRENPVISPANQKKLEKEFEALKKRNKEVVDSREKQIAEYAKLLTEESDVVLYKVKMGDLPKEMTNKQMEKVYAIVEEV